MTDRGGGRRRALLIAVDEYADPAIPDLRAPLPDTARLAAVLGDPAIGRFSVDRAINPTRQELHLRIEQFYDSAGSQDVLLLYFAGHAFLDGDGALRFAGTDTRKDFLKSTALASREVSELAGASMSRRILVVLDCCYSARFFDGLAPRGDDSVHLTDQMPLGDAGMVVLAASGSLEYAYEDQTASQYTRLLVRGLRTGAADLDGDGLISADELHSYVSDGMRGHSRNQRPQRLAMGGSVPIIVARALHKPEPEPKPDAPPQPDPRSGTTTPPIQPSPSASPAQRGRDRPESAVGTAPVIIPPAPTRPAAGGTSERLSAPWAFWAPAVAVWVGATALVAAFIVLGVRAAARDQSLVEYVPGLAVVQLVVAVIIILAGVVALFRRMIFAGILLVVIGLCIGPVAMSYFS